ncbi:hypothetical protein AAMO2058_000401900 [Amorphochlora amoebiformis]
MAMSPKEHAYPPDHGLNDEMLALGHRYLTNRARKRRQGGDAKSVNWWTREEERTLVKGVKELGKGRWSMILHKYRGALRGRTTVDLKDKWRNIERAEARRKRLKLARAAVEEMEGKRHRSQENKKCQENDRPSHQKHHQTQGMPLPQATVTRTAVPLRSPPPPPLIPAPTFRSPVISRIQYTTRKGLEATHTPYATRQEFDPSHTRFVIQQNLNDTGEIYAAQQDIHDTHGRRFAIQHLRGVDSSYASDRKKK